MSNRSTGRSPFEIVYTRPPWFAFNVVSLTKSPSMSMSAELLAEWFQSIQVDIRNKLEQANKKYKQVANKHRRAKTFQEGDLVMIHLHKNRFPTWTYDKVQGKKYGPCRILKKISDNAYAVELLEDMSVFPTFNVSDLFEYQD